MTTKFRFKGFAEILHLNTRKHGDEDKVLAVDVKFQTETDAEMLDTFEPALRQAVFTDVGAVRNIQLGPLTFTHEMEHYRLEFFGSTMVGCKVKKFSLEPKDTNRIVLTFQVSFQPSGDEVAKLAEYLQDAVEIVIEPEDGELDLGGGEGGAS